MTIRPGVYKVYENLSATSKFYASQSKFRAEGPQMLCITTQNLVAQDLCTYFKEFKTFINVCTRCYREPAELSPFAHKPYLLRFT